MKSAPRPPSSQSSPASPTSRSSPRVADEAVVLGVAGDLVVAVAAGHVLHVAADVVSSPAAPSSATPSKSMRRSSVPGSSRRCRCAAAGEVVGAGAALQDVVARPADEPVVAAAAVQVGPDDAGADRDGVAAGVAHDEKAADAGGVERADGGVAAGEESEPLRVTLIASLPLVPSIVRVSPPVKLMPSPGPPPGRRAGP